MSTPTKPKSSSDAVQNPKTLPQIFTASEACVHKREVVVNNVTISSLCELEQQIDDMLNCEEAERAFATLRKKMERDARQKETKKEEKKRKRQKKEENIKKTLWLFNMILMLILCIYFIKYLVSH
jgi:ribosomal protein L12E/L44/L45/RPP1/RPP2